MITLVADLGFSGDRLIVGARTPSEIDTFSQLLTTTAPIVPSTLRTGAGIVRTAMASTAGDRT